VTELARRVWAWVGRKGLTEFCERDAQRGTHARVAKDVKAALAQLCERGLIRARPMSPTGGRPSSPRYDVRPAG
jgi:hypothetical protein